MNLTPELIADLRNLIEYNWADEQHDFEVHGPEANSIFPALQRLKAALPEES